jgi:glycosyltransferase involved in cell wall biosynthesis
VPEPRLSAVIPVYNTARYLRDAVESALAQEGADLEVIVVDDGSTDEGPAILRGFGDRIRLLRQENRGLSAARNAGIAEARGEFIGFLDADDAWEPAKSMKQIAYLDAHPACGLVFCDARRMDGDGALLEPVYGDTDHGFRPGRCLERLFEGNLVVMPGVVVRRGLFDEAGLFDTTLASVEDYDMWLRLAALTEFGMIREPLARYRVHGAQMSGNRARMLDCEERVLRRALERNPELRRRLGRRARRRMARLYDEHGWWELQDGRYRAALAKFWTALRHDPLMPRIYGHLVRAAAGSLNVGGAAR